MITMITVKNFNTLGETNKKIVALFEEYIVPKSNLTADLYEKMTFKDAINFLYDNMIKK